MAIGLRSLDAINFEGLDTTIHSVDLAALVHLRRLSPWTSLFKLENSLARKTVKSSLELKGLTARCFLPNAESERFKLVERTAKNGPEGHFLELSHFSQT